MCHGCRRVLHAIARWMGLAGRARVGRLCSKAASQIGGLPPNAATLSSLDREFADIEKLRATDRLRSSAPAPSRAGRPEPAGRQARPRRGHLRQSYPAPDDRGGQVVKRHARCGDSKPGRPLARRTSSLGGLPPADSNERAPLRRQSATMARQAEHPARHGLSSGESWAAVELSRVPHLDV